MTGYAMSNYFLARFFQEQKLDAPKLKAVITSSEKLTVEMRGTFQSVYIIAKHTIAGVDLKHVGWFQSASMARFI
jgi:hypothetical protein